MTVSASSPRPARSWRSWFTRLWHDRLWPWRDSLRLSLQTVAAVVIAYSAMRLAGLPDLSWAAFSALFVVRGSLEGTVGEAVARVLGALIGAALGVVLVAMLGGVWPLVFVAALGVGTMSLLVARWPALGYGLVTVAIITVTPDFNLLDGAWHKSLAILVGSISGVVAAGVVFPRSARVRARAKLAESLAALGSTLRECTSTFTDCEADPRTTPHASVDPASEDAREMLLQARAGLLRRQAQVRPVDAALVHIDNLWRAVPALDRATDSPLSEAACTLVAEPMDAVAEAFEEDARALASAIRAARRSAAEPGAPAALQALEDAVRARLGDADLSDADRNAIHVATWTWRVVIRELERLDQELRER